MHTDDGAQSPVGTSAWAEAMSVLANAGFGELARVLGALLREAHKLEMTRPVAASGSKESVTCDVGTWDVPASRRDRREGVSVNGWLAGSMLLPAVGERRRAVVDFDGRSERALRLTIAEACLDGRATRKTVALAGKLCGQLPDRAEVRRERRRLDRQLNACRRRHACWSLAKLALGLAAALAAALQVALLLTWFGYDPRGSLLGTYDQRNALVVGFVMGFAIIPIIYTIADDALSSVPNHLRFGSLGAGATAWQTTVRIVIPTAVSGLFSALMIGLGRAVGETMIVLMAAGNTPILEWNIFNGFRTLAANIAVELPEAARGSVHYRTLFLAALTLFVLTFAVNTVAELVRLRFRRHQPEMVQPAAGSA